jgi:NhaC family Na+:H+ antiporter
MSKQVLIKRASLLQALLPLLVLIGLLGLNVVIYGEDSSYGPNQISLILASGIAALIGIYNKVDYGYIKEKVVKSISSVMTAIIILLLIGALVGTWVISGIVPAMVYYGLQILNPGIFLFAACVISAIVSLATGSSWTTIATVGAALLVIGETMGISSAITAGAIISGAYFGDKMSPLSDTTNLAPAVSGSDLFTHIRHMAWTTIPTFSVTLIIFLIIGFSSSGNASLDVSDGILRALKDNFNLTPILFIVPIVVIFLIIRKVPAIPSLLAGTLLGGLFGIIFQPNIIESVGSVNQINVDLSSFKNEELKWFKISGDGDRQLVEDFDMTNAKAGKYFLEVKGENQLYGYANVSVPNHGTEKTEIGALTIKNDGIIQSQEKISLQKTGYAKASYIAVTNAMMTSLTTNGENYIHTGNENVDKLVQGKGMEGMLNTVWLIICAMLFGGVMEACGFLHRLTEAIMSVSRSKGGLIASTSGTCIVLNGTASDQYMAIVVPGKMFKEIYKQKGLAPENLSRTLEDSGTVTSVLIPWNTCGAAQSSVLGVATGDYFMFCFFNWLSPITTIIYGYLGIKVNKLETKEENGMLVANSMDDID